MSDWVVWLLLIAPFCAVLCVILWDARDRDKRSGLRLEKETVPIAIREWLKACGFLAASVAAMFAFWQFDLAKERAETDRRPWVSLSDFTPGHIQINLVNHKEDGGSYTVIFSAKAKNVGLSPARRLKTAFVQYGEGVSFAEYLSEKGFREQNRRRDATASEACAETENMVASTGVFATEAATVQILGHFGPNVRKKPPVYPETQSFGGVACLTYLSSLTNQVHHTAYSLEITVSYASAEAFPTYELKVDHVSIVD